MTAENGTRKLQNAILESDLARYTSECPDAARWMAVYSGGRRSGKWSEDELRHLEDCGRCQSTVSAYEAVVTAQPSHWSRLLLGVPWKAVVIAIAFAILPAVLIREIAELRTNYAHSLPFWVSSFSRELLNVGGVVGALSGLCWLTASKNDWLATPTLSLCLGVASVFGGTLYNQDRLANYASEEVIEREELFQSTRWILVDSVFFWPDDPAAVEATGHLGQQPTAAQIRLELQTLANVGFTGVYVFGSPQRDFLSIADELGFAVIQGMTIHDPKNFDDPRTQQEIQAGIESQEFIDAYVLGHVRSADVSMLGLQKELAKIRRQTQKPVTPNFLLSDYLGQRGQRLLRLSDFVVADLPRPYSHVPPSGDPQVAAEAVERAIDELRQIDAPAILSLVGYPSRGGEGFTADNQADFVKRVLQIDVPRGVGIAWTSGFDLPWKQKLSETTPFTMEADANLGFFRTVLSEDGNSATFEAKPSVTAFPQRDDDGR